MKVYKKIDDTKLEETTTSKRTIDKEFLLSELEAIKENIKAYQDKEKELETLLNKLK